MFELESGQVFFLRSSGDGKDEMDVFVEEFTNNMIGAIFSGESKLGLHFDNVVRINEILRSFKHIFWRRTKIISYSSSGKINGSLNQKSSSHAIKQKKY